MTIINLYGQDEQNIYDTTDDTIINVYDHATAYVYGSGIVYIWDHGYAVLYGNCFGTYSDFSVGELQGMSKAMCFDNSHLYMCDETMASVYDDTVVKAVGNSSVTIYDRARVFAYSKNLANKPPETSFLYLYGFGNPYPNGVLHDIDD